MVSVNLTEIDIINVKVGDKATLTFDAYPNKTYTGKVVSVDTIGSVSSGVTNYPTLISLDNTTLQILPNMSVSANIITDTKTDVLAVTSSAVKTQDGVSTVDIIKNGRTQTVTVETGISSETQTEITSGLSEGDIVVTSTTSATSSTSSSKTGSSPFGGGLGGGVRMIR
jgi:multidrug efflux pump subunit AcrA (membrane-fusion protein)